MSLSSFLQKNRRACLFAVAFSGFNLLGLAAASGATIISDTFTRSGTLAGSSPDTDTASTTWAVNTAGGTNSGTATTNGSILTITSQVSTGADENAFIGFTPAATGLLSASADVTYGSGSWGAIGLSTGTGANTDPFSNNGPWMLLTASAVQTFAGPGTINQVNSGLTTTSATHSLKVTYDPTSKVATWFLDDKPVSRNTTNGNADGTFTYSTGPVITGLFLTQRGNAGTSSTYDNALVTQIPEPAFVGLLGLALLALKRGNRQNRSA